MWEVVFDRAFKAEFNTLEQEIQDAVLKYARLLEIGGPQLGRPYADTLKGSKHKNMKELRPTVNKVEWRVAYAFDPQRKGVLLAGVAKNADKRAYRKLIAMADKRFSLWLASLDED
jgi:hypothetical protein